MKITIETSGIEEVEQLLLLLDKLDVKKFKINLPQKKLTPSITRGDKSIDSTTLFGIWKDAPRTLEQIRKIGWER